MNTRNPLRVAPSRFIVACIMGLLVAYAVCWYRGHLSFLGVGNIGVTLVVFAVSVRYCIMAKRPERFVLIVVGAGLFAAMASLGEIFSVNGTFTDLAHLSALFGFLGYWAVAALTVHAIFAGGQVSGCGVDACDSEADVEAHSFFLRHRVFLTAFIVILAGWFITIVALFPGLGFYDSMWQLSQFRGYTPDSTQHPLFATLVMGAFSGLFSFWGDTVMFACYTLVQTLLCAGVLAYVATCIVRCFAPAEYLNHNRATPSNRIGGAVCRRTYYCAVAFFALVPLFPIYAMSILKDQVYAVSITVAVLLLISVFSEKAVVTSRAFSVLYCLSMVGIAGFRNEGWIVAAAITVVMFVALHGTRKWFITVAGVASIALVFSVNSVAASVLEATPGPSIEAFAVPNQQIAREMNDHPESFTEEELQQLSDMLVTDAAPSMLGERYSPDNSDAVKLLFNWDFYSRRSTIKIWLRHLMLHPVTYIEAFLSGSSGYYYPFTEKMAGSVFDSFQWLQPDIKDGWRQYFQIPDHALDPEYPHATESLRNGLVNCLHDIYTLPVVNAVFSPATYVWCMLLAALIIINKRRYTKLWVLLPTLLILGICVLSPINGSIRYALPLLYCAPLLLAFACSLANKVTKTVDSTISGNH